MYDKEMLDNFSRDYAPKCRVTDQISAELFDANGVLRGLRDKNGNGVVAGLTNISKIESFRMENGQKIPCDGNLWYRGYNVIDLVKGFEGKRYGFEEVTYLLLFGELPSPAQLKTFCEALANARHLPTNFTRDVIMKAPSADLMNSLTRSVLTLASYDDGISDSSLQTVLMQCMKLISEMPMLAVYGYHSYNHFLRDESLYIHRPQPELSTAENILLMLRPDKKYTALEAQVLDALDIATICPLHGPVLTGDLSKYLNYYDLWSSYKAEEPEKILVASASIHGHTRAAAHTMAEKLRAKGAKVVEMDLTRTDVSYAVTEAFRCGRIVLACATYDGFLFPPMENLLTHLKTKNFQGRTVGLMENGTWAPMAAKLMRAELDGMKNITVCDAVVTIRSAANAAAEAQMDVLADELMAK